MTIRIEKDPASSEQLTSYRMMAGDQVLARFDIEADIGSARSVTIYSNLGEEITFSTRDMSAFLNSNTPYHMLEASGLVEDKRAIGALFYVQAITHMALISAVMPQPIEKTPGMPELYAQQQARIKTVQEQLLNGEVAPQESVNKLHALADEIGRLNDEVKKAVTAKQNHFYELLEMQRGAPHQYAEQLEIAANYLETAEQIFNGKHAQVLAAYREHKKSDKNMLN